MTDPTTLFAILLITALVVCSIGFIRLVWFISIGYGYAIAAMAVVLGVAGASAEKLSALLIGQLALLFVYGLRLGTHVWRRERNAAYRRAAKENYGEPGGGLGLKWLADRQKTAAKRKAPERFCDSGLFAWVRCPAYLGEILFWMGNWTLGAASFSAWWHWLGSAVGLVCIILIMLGSTKRLEASQNRRYGELEAFQKYRETVPILFPWVPIYSLAKLRWTLG
jgi:steroid 5-alpha reductase family enzyme